MWPQPHQQVVPTRTVTGGIKRKKEGRQTWKKLTANAGCTRTTRGRNPRDQMEVRGGEIGREAERWGRRRKRRSARRHSYTHSLTLVLGKLAPCGHRSFYLFLSCAKTPFRHDLFARTSQQIRFPKQKEKRKKEKKSKGGTTLFIFEKKRKSPFCLCLIMMSS